MFLWHVWFAVECEVDLCLGPSTRTPKPTGVDFMDPSAWESDSLPPGLQPNRTPGRYMQSTPPGPLAPPHGPPGDGTKGGAVRPTDHTPSIEGYISPISPHLGWIETPARCLSIKKPQTQNEGTPPPCQAQIICMRKHPGWCHMSLFAFSPYIFLVRKHRGCGIAEGWHTSLKVGRANVHRNDVELVIVKLVPAGGGIKLTAFKDVGARLAVLKI